MANAIHCKKCGWYQADHDGGFGGTEDDAKELLPGYKFPLLGEILCRYEGEELPVTERESERELNNFPGGH